MSTATEEDARTEQPSRELALSQAFYRSLVESLPQNVLRKDRDGRFVFANLKFCDLVGKPFDQIVGRTDFDLFPADLAEKYRQDDRIVMERGERYETVEEHQAASGERLYVQLIKSPIYSMENEILGVHCIFWDVTEHKRAEEKLRESEEQFRLLFEQAPVAYHEIDRRGILRRVNQAECVLLGYEASELVGHPIWDFVAPEAQAQSREAIQKKMSEAQPLASFTRDYRRRDGSQLVLEIRESLVRDREGKVVGIRSSLLDITARARAEEAIQKAKETAEAANQAKSQFLANMSHEIRTPMNGIMGMMELALDTPLNSEQRDYLETARTCAESLLVIINEILDFSKMEIGRFTLDPSTFNLRENVTTVLKSLAPQAIAKKLELVCDLTPEVPDWIVGDDLRLRQILVNLVGNAIKFTDHGRIVVQVAVHLDAGNELQLHFRVADTGIGVSREHHQRIFEAFVQADSSATRRFGGTGLGLAICSQLVQMMGGSIWVESEPGRGSIFHFTLAVRRNKSLV